MERVEHLVNGCPKLENERLEKCYGLNSGPLSPPRPLWTLLGFINTLCLKHGGL